VCCDRLEGRLVLVSPDGVLGEAPLPAPPPRGKLVAVRPAPSGWVVALRYKQQRQLDLVDLRTGAQRRVELEHTPRELEWSPTGRALAVSCQRGALVLLGG
jgi:hypothetical protein